MTRIIPQLWYAQRSEGAARFHASVIPDRHVDHVTQIPADPPSGSENSVPVLKFALKGQPLVVIAAGPLDLLNHAVSFVIECDSQEEIDRLWDALS